MDPEPSITVFSPIYIVASEYQCYACNGKNRVLAIATQRLAETEDGEEHVESTDDELIILTNVESIPQEIERELADQGFPLVATYSVMAGMEYMLHHCTECGAKFGDHFLHKFGGPFWPETRAEAELLELTRLSITGEVHFSAGYGLGGGGEIIWKYGRRVNF